MKFVRIGDRLLNLDAVSSAAFYPASRIAINGQSLLNINSWETQVEQYEGAEAEVLWAYLSATSNCRTLAVPPSPEQPPNP